MMLTLPRLLSFSLVVLAFFALPEAALAAEAHAPKELLLKNKDLPIFWGIPFVGMLLSIALFPLCAPTFWHHNFGKIAAFWAACFLIPAYVLIGWGPSTFTVLEVLMHEYLPFIILLFALFTIAGGVRLKGTLVGKPVTNLTLLLIGTLLASWMGTTGAAMLLIRPLLRANADRKFKVHTVVFFIILVANIGGALTPLGDPPLFLGFLKGIRFFWPTQALLLPMIFVSGLVLVVYYLLDRFYFYPREDAAQMKKAQMEMQMPIRIEGAVNFLLLGGVVAAVLLSGSWRPAFQPVEIFFVDYKTQNLVRDILLICLAGLSLLLTQNESRKANGFNWFPIMEVAKLFIGIFITIAPVIAILKSGSDGALGFIINAVSSTDGEPIPRLYFWFTGLLSGYLDNAPTYVVFFEATNRSALELMTTHAATLMAISMGAVFMGALSYIGNAPNFMVKAIAEDAKVKMPSFFGYMIWSFSILLPIFILVTLIFL